MNLTKAKVGIASAVLACAVGVPWAWYEVTVWPQRRALPWSASDVHEWSWEEGFLPDYNYYLKARIRPSDFRAYVQRRHLTPHTATRQYDDSTGWLVWSRSEPDCRGAWWKPTESLDDTYVSNHGECWEYAKYEDGYIYLKSLNH